MYGNYAYGAEGSRWDSCPLPRIDAAVPHVDNVDMMFIFRFQTTHPVDRPYHRVANAQQNSTLPLSLGLYSLPIPPRVGG